MHHTQNLLDKNQAIAFRQKIGTLEITKTNQPYLPVTGNMNVSAASQSKRRGENCAGWYSRGLKNQNR